MRPSVCQSCCSSCGYHCSRFPFGYCVWNKDWRAKVQSTVTPRPSTQSPFLHHSAFLLFPHIDMGIHARNPTKRRRFGQVWKGRVGSREWEVVWLLFEQLASFGFAETSCGAVASLFLEQFVGYGFAETSCGPVARLVFEQLASGRMRSHGFFARASNTGKPRNLSRAETQSRRGKRNLKPAIQIGTICCWVQSLPLDHSRLGLAVLCVSARDCCCPWIIARVENH